MRKCEHFPFGKASSLKIRLGKQMKQHFWKLSAKTLTRRPERHKILFGYSHVNIYNFVNMFPSSSEVYKRP